MLAESKHYIPLDLKRRCVAAANSGMTVRQVFEDVFYPEHQQMKFESFRRRLQYWKNAAQGDTETLCAGTYEGFTAHDATVQVNKDGQIVQAWIKQALDDGQWDELIRAIHENKDPVRIEPANDQCSEAMLEISLYDMHFPFSDHHETAEQLIELVQRKRWEEINIIIGQDLFHNDDMRGRTASGRPIEKVDIAFAWQLARDFWFNVIDNAIAYSKKVNIIYSVGNHDESLAWAFVQLLKDHYPQLNVDDSLKQRKCISWKNCFIGVTHGDYTKNAPVDFRGQFTIEFPHEFATSTVREIHSGHLHHEREADIYGVMVRRLSRSGVTDKWSEDEGYVGAHKRFMVFEWKPGKLSDIHYLG